MTGTIQMPTEMAAQMASDFDNLLASYRGEKLKNAILEESMGEIRQVAIDLGFPESAGLGELSQWVLARVRELKAVGGSHNPLDHRLKAMAEKEGVW